MLLQSIFQYVYVDHDSNLERCVEVVVLMRFTLYKSRSPFRFLIIRK